MFRAERRRPGCGTQSASPGRRSSRFARRTMRTRKAILPDAQQIHDLIAGYSGDGTLLPRTLPEICENVRDFVVLENDGRIIGCGALHLYGTHLAEIRSITVVSWAQIRGGGWRYVLAICFAKSSACSSPTRLRVHPPKPPPVMRPPRKPGRPSAASTIMSSSRQLTS